MAHLEEVLGELRWSGRQPESKRVTPVNWWDEKRPWVIAAGGGFGACSRDGASHEQEPARHPATSGITFPGQEPSFVRAGQVIETGLRRATMESEFIGEVDIHPNSRLRLLASREGQHRLALDHGTISALIWAPPAKFTVDTPAAKAVDLNVSVHLVCCAGRQRIFDCGVGLGSV